MYIYIVSSTTQYVVLVLYTGVCSELTGAVTTHAVIMTTLHSALWDVLPGQWCIVGYAVCVCTHVPTYFFPYMLP